MTIAQMLVHLLLAADIAGAPLSYRVVPLACTANALVISGGGVLRVSPQGSCTGVVPGRAISTTLDDDTRAIPAKGRPGVACRQRTAEGRVFRGAQERWRRRRPHRSS